MSDLASRTFEVRDATLSYEMRDGTGPMIIALHGLGGSRASDDKSGYLDWAAMGGAGRKFVRYDARGHGLSVGRPEPKDYTWPNLADDLLALIDELSPDEPVDAVGVSMGTGTLLHAAVRRPERFRRLALILPPTAWETRAAQGDAYRQMATIFETQGPEALAVMMGAAPVLPLLAEGGWSISAPDIRPEVAAAVLRGAALADLPPRDAVAKIQQPVLLLPWVDDPSHPVATAEELKKLLPDATMRVTETAEDLRDVGARVARFFSS